MIKIDLEKLTPNLFLLLFSMSVALFSSGLLFILVFGKDLFFDFDNLKLILLSIAITSPITYLNANIAYIMNNFLTDNSSWTEDKKAFEALAGSAFLTIFIFSVISLVRIFINFSIAIAVISFISFEFLLFVITGIVKDQKEKSKKAALSGDKT